MTTYPRHSNRSGQAMLFLIMVLLIGTFVVLWNFDLHRAVIVKMKVRDAGDAAALASARWDGIALNTIGELNLIQASVLTEMIRGEMDLYAGMEQVRSINDLRRRVQYNGPIVSFAAAQQAAFNNGVYANPNYRGDLKRAIQRGRASTQDEVHLECLDFFEAVVDSGVAVMERSPYASYHVLHDPDFYAAIRAAKRDNWWCLFYLYPEFVEHLESYTTAEDYWEDFTSEGWRSVYNDLHVSQSGRTLDRILGVQDEPQKADELQQTLDELTEDKDLDIDVDLFRSFNTTFGDSENEERIRWGIYNQSRWKRSWNEYIDENEIPFRSAVRDEYDYMAGVSLFELDDRISGVFSDNDVRWVSAAKVFGYVNVDGERKAPAYFGVVLPAFRDARLIPVPRTLNQVYPGRLSSYLEDGISALDEDGDGIADTGSWYHQMLIYFDDPDFRQQGIEWLATHSEDCAGAGFVPGNSNKSEGKGPAYAH